MFVEVSFCAVLKTEILLLKLYEGGDVFLWLLMQLIWFVCLLKVDTELEPATLGHDDD